MKTIRKFLTLAFCLGLLAAFAVGANAASVQNDDGTWVFQGITVTDDGELDEDFVKKDIETVENSAVFPAFYTFDGTTAIRIIEDYADYNIYAAEVETGWLYNRYNAVQLSDDMSFEMADVTIYAVEEDEDDADGGYKLTVLERISLGDLLIYVTDGEDVVYGIVANDSILEVQDLYYAICADQRSEDGTAVPLEAALAEEAAA